MTPEEIETAAIEVATKRHWELSYQESRCKTFDDEPDWRKVALRHKTAEICRAYERAMWRPISEAPKDGTKLLLDLDGEVNIVGQFYGSNGEAPAWRTPWDYSRLETGYTVTHFRPLPKRGE
jgi:hypothetical protein